MCSTLNVKSGSSALRAGPGYAALGEMALVHCSELMRCVTCDQAVKSDILPHLSVIIALVKDGLSASKPVPEALTCVSQLARAVKSGLTPHIMKDLVG